MACLGVCFRYGLLLISLVVFVLSHEPKLEKSYCTSENCDEDDQEEFWQEDEDDRANAVHLAYECAEPYVNEEKVPVIFLHGLTDTRKTWEGIYKNIPILTHRKACVYDARNHGDSSWNSSFNVNFLAEDLESLMDKLNIQRAILVGHSMGGLTAMKFALKNPDRVESLFIEDMSPVHLNEQGLYFVQLWVKALLSSISIVPEDTDEDTAKKMIVDYIREAIHNEPPESFSQHTPVRQSDGKWRWKANFDVINKALSLPDTFLVHPEGQYKGYTLLAYGKDSVFKVAEQEQDIRKFFPNSEFVGLEGGDHLLHGRHPEFMKELVKFLWREEV